MVFMAAMDTLTMGMEVDIIVLGTDLDIGHQTTDQAIDPDLQILPQDQDDQRLYLQIDHLQEDHQLCHHDLRVDRLADQ